jgi:hypothetical protein
MRRCFALLPITVIACRAGPVSVASQQLTSTVSVSSQSTLLVTSPLPLDVLGAVARSNVLAQLNAIVTASTSTGAVRIAKGITMTTSNGSDPSQVMLAVAAPSGAEMITGTLNLTIPALFGISAQITNGGTAQVAHVQGPIALMLDNSVVIQDAGGSVNVAITGGSALVDTRAPPGSTTQVILGSGDIEIDLPVGVSVTIDAQVADTYSVVVNHPALPAAIGPLQTHYATQVNGGLAVIRCSTGLGTITFGVRQGG